MYGSRRTASTSGRISHIPVNGTSMTGSGKLKARMYAMPMAVPGIARISVVSASIVLRPGARVRAMIHAIGTPTTRHRTSASPA